MSRIFEDFCNLIMIGIVFFLFLFLKKTFNFYRLVDIDCQYYVVNSLWLSLA